MLIKDGKITLVESQGKETQVSIWKTKEDLIKYLIFKLDFGTADNLMDDILNEMVDQLKHEDPEGEIIDYDTEEENDLNDV